MDFDETAQSKSGFLCRVHINIRPNPLKASKLVLELCSAQYELKSDNPRVRWCGRGSAVVHEENRREQGLRELIPLHPRQISSGSGQGTLLDVEAGLGELPVRRNGGELSGARATRVFSSSFRRRFQGFSGNPTPVEAGVARGELAGANGDRLWLAGDLPMTGGRGRGVSRGERGETGERKRTCYEFLFFYFY